ncbi:Sodium/hydrogen exchanger 2 [Lathyrus oleraceus]|uniref:Sodium/hydrogen exchanger 2 n=1 Tax=Pisum sativum TaxID=3888 RepID=A0A9D4XEU3_PEA|nr:Sodium/hydrogen exchanger 2 [Pisum sativum]
MTAPFFASNTTVVAYFFGKEVWDSGAGIVAAVLIAICPGYISRSVAGSYDNEGVATRQLQRSPFNNLAGNSSTLLGVLTGLLSAYVIKKLYIGRHSTDREFALMMLMTYLSYMVAELFYLSGILTVFFCGIVMSHYTWHNVTESSRVTTKHSFATLSFVVEIFIFLYVGMDALDIEKWKFVSDSPGTSIATSSVLLGLVLLGRATFIFPLSYLSNLTKKSQYQKISFRQQVIIWWAGLMRGVVSMALAYNQFMMSGHTQLHSNAIMITSTITVVLFSIVVFGLLTKPLIRLLLPHSKVTTSMTTT